MNKSVNPVVAILIVLFFVGLIGFNFFFNQRALEVERPTFVAVTSDGRLAVQVGRRLFLIDSAGGEEVVDLGQLGFADNIGNFDFFANGDILLRTGSGIRSLSEELEVTLRFGNDNFAPATDNALSRCSLGQLTCSEFSAHLPGFDRAFRVFVDRKDDTVYLADASRHRVLKLDGSGQLLAFRDGFKFPNQVALIEDQLWVADTNHNRLVAVSAETEGFGEELLSIAVEPDSQHIWPSAFVRVDDEWWVLAMGNNMSDGIVVRYTTKGTELGQLDMPRNADPLSVGIFGDDILVTDYRNFAIYRFNRDGGRLVDFSTPLLAKELAAKQSEAERWSGYAYSCWGIFALALLVGFVVAIRQQRKEKQHAEGVGAGLETGNLEPVPTSGIWIESNRMARWMPNIVLLTSLTVPLMLTPLLLDDKPIPAELATIVVSMAIALLIMVKPMRYLAGVRIGVFDKHIEVHNSEGQRYRAGFAEVPWHKQGAIVVGVQVVPLRRKNQYGLFPQKEIERWISPRLLLKNEVGGWALMKHQWQSPDGIMRSSTWMVAILSGLCLYLERESLWAWLQSFI